MELKITKFERMEYGKIRARMEGDFEHLYLEALVKEGELIELMIKDNKGSRRVTHWKGSIIPRHNQADRWEFVRQLGEFIIELQKEKEN